jgi:hypothetical protein
MKKLLRNLPVSNTVVRYHRIVFRKAIIYEIPVVSFSYLEGTQLACADADKEWATITGVSCKRFHVKQNISVFWGTSKFKRKISVNISQGSTVIFCVISV